MASINWSLSRARIENNPGIGINQFLRKPSTIAALGLAAFTTLLLAQVAGEYLATKVQDGETVEGSRYGLLSVRADHICLSWPRQSGMQQAQDAQKADPSQRPYRKLTGPFIYLGKSGDDLVLYDFLRLTAGDEWLNQGEGPGGLLRIPKGNSIVTQVALPGRDLETVTSLRNSFSVDVQGANAARQRLANQCSEVNAEMFPD
jgi:hypothetical protein